MKVKNKKPTKGKVLFMRMDAADHDDLVRLAKAKGYPTLKGFILAVLKQMKKEEWRAS